MKRSIYIALLVVFTMFFAHQAEAQVSGHRGGWLVVKTDLMSPLLDFGAHGGLEFVAFRRASFTVDYNLQREFLGGNLLKRDNYFDNEYGENAMIMAHTIALGVRFYSNKAVPAPYGSHWDIKFGIARMRLSGEVSGYSSADNYSFTYGPLGAGTLTLGYGYQWILFTRMTIDLGFSVQFNFVPGYELVDVSETYPDVNAVIEVSDFTNLYGSNIINGGNIFTTGIGVHLAIGLIVP